MVAAQTRLSCVDGAAGELIIAGFPVEILAGRATFEEVVYLLWHQVLPTSAQLAGFRAELAARRQLPAATLALLSAAAAQRRPVMEVLGMAAGTLALDTPAADDLALTVVARFPVVVAAYARLLAGQTPLPSRADLGHAAHYLYLLAGIEPGPDQVRGLETYLNTVVDHGMSASTFTARVITSTGSDLVSAVAGALGALKGPLHGGAPGPALDMVFEIGQAGRAEMVLREKLARHERLMGFGHRVYRTRDPRAEVLAQAAAEMYQRAGDLALYTLAREVEAIAVRLLTEYYPGRQLQTNVEYYTALLLHGLGLTTDLFTPTFAVSRVAGWIAHIFEQRRESRIIRPESEYIGELRRAWVPLEARG